MVPSPKKWSCTLKNFFTHFLRKCGFFQKKLLNIKMFNTSFPIKKVIFIFVARRSLLFKRNFGPRNGFLPFSQKIQPFLKQLLNNKIFSTLFVIKEVMLIFGPRCLLSLKNCQVCPQNSFSRFSRKMLLFLKKLSSNKLFSISFLMKNIILGEA